MTRAPLILLTGAPGWLGTRLTECLLRGMPELESLHAPRADVVRCLALPGVNVDALAALGDAVQIVRGDVTDKNSLNAFFDNSRNAVLIHAAGIVHPKRRISELFDVNSQGTATVLQQAKAAGIRRFLYVSSNSPLGTNPRASHRFDEHSPYNPSLAYGRSKQIAEEHISLAQDSGDLETTIIRPPWFYGPGQPPRQSLFFSMIRDGRAPIVGSGENRRSMAFIDNICQGILLAAESPRAIGKKYWIADERAYTMNEIINTIERLMSDEFDIAVRGGRLRLPELARTIAYGIDRQLQRFGLYHQKFHVLSEMNQTIAGSIDAAERDLGYRPHISLKEGMRRSLRWMTLNGQRLN
ncbi:MAG: NAD(P)-dependent oxidoreductase [Polyangiaceae bacterium]|nr:NAD(P)-dependent oxidoreductase [Polyangiaceae bacterium]